MVMDILSDLGSAQFSYIAFGAIIYAAPEVTHRDSAHQQTVKIDVYNYGVLLIARKIPTESIDVLLRSVQSPAVLMLIPTRDHQ